MSEKDQNENKKVKDQMELKLKVLSDNKECIEWVLGQQAELRSELMTFFKKDLKEIDSALSELKPSENAKDFSAKIVEQVRDIFVDHWKSSFQLVSPDLSRINIE
jgi:hypothetical protein